MAERSVEATAGICGSTNASVAAAWTRHATGRLEHPLESRADTFQCRLMAALTAFASVTCIHNMVWHSAISILLALCHIPNTGCSATRGPTFCR